MTPLEYVEMGLYAALTLVFVGAGVYGLWLLFTPSLASVSVEGLVLPAAFVIVMLAVILLGATAGSGGDET